MKNQILIFLCLIVVAFGDVFRPRGVQLTKKVFYDPNKDFMCIDGSKSMPFIQVNDDYCDCQDGSDEPGTSACPNSNFNCPNLGYFEKNIHSSKVNDGICDCCDGSDEYSSEANCVNNCQELGDISREAQRQELEKLQSGNEIRNQYLQQARDKKAEVSGQLEQIKIQQIDLEKEKNDKAKVKTDAEEAERVALEKHNLESEAEKQRQFELNEAHQARENEKKVALLAFKELDINQDGVLSYLEIMKFGKFDQNGDNVVTEEEAKFFLHGKDSMDVDEFVLLGWIVAKPFYLKDKTEEFVHEEKKESLTEEQQENPEHTGHLEQPEHTYDQDAEFESHGQEDLNTYETERDEYAKNEEYNEEADEEEESRHEKPEADAEPEYDEQTKLIIEEAKKAKSDFFDVESRYMQVNTKIRELENFLANDYGKEDEFMVLHGQCFEYTDREYIYTLCPFDRASQRSKNGGGEVNLGRWGHWSGNEQNQYEQFRLEAGAVCWNGPARITDVILKCGIENQITSVTEPSRCEYRFEFNTPARCNLKTEQVQHVHTEL